MSGWKYKTGEDLVSVAHYLTQHNIRFEIVREQARLIRIWNKAGKDYMYWCTTGRWYVPIKNRKGKTKYYFCKDIATFCAEHINKYIEQQKARKKKRGNMKEVCQFLRNYKGGAIKFKYFTKRTEVIRISGQDKDYIFWCKSNRWRTTKQAKHTVYHSSGIKSFIEKYYLKDNPISIFQKKKTPKKKGYVYLGTTGTMFERKNQE
jgi:hypothetical protein